MANIGEEDTVGCPACGNLISKNSPEWFCGPSCEQYAEMDWHERPFDWDWYEHVDNPPYVLSRCYRKDE